MLVKCDISEAFGYEVLSLTNLPEHTLEAQRSDWIGPTGNGNIGVSGKSSKDLANCSQSLSPNAWNLEASEVQGKICFRKLLKSVKVWWRSLARTDD